MELDATLRTWMGRIGWPKEEFWGNCGVSTSVLIGRIVAPLVSSPPVPSAAINRILPMGCCCRDDVGRIMLCIGMACWAGCVAVVVGSKEGLPFCCWIVLIVISDWGGIAWVEGGEGGEQDLWLMSGSALMTCTRGGGEEVVDEREGRKWRVFSMGDRITAGGEGLTRLMEDPEVVFKAEVFMTCRGWLWCWVDPLVNCEGWEMRRIGCPAMVWITFIGAWVWPLLREIPFALIGIKLAGLFGAAWRMLTGAPPLEAGRRVGVWINVGWLLLPVCTKLTAPPTWPGVVNIRFGGRVTICPWLGRELKTFGGGQMLTGLCSLGLVVPRHSCLGEGTSELSGFKLRFRRLTAEERNDKSLILECMQDTYSVNGARDLYYHNQTTVY